MSFAGHNGSLYSKAHISNHVIETPQGSHWPGGVWRTGLMCGPGGGWKLAKSLNSTLCLNVMRFFCHTHSKNRNTYKKNTHWFYACFPSNKTKTSEWWVKSIRGHISTCQTKPSENNGSNCIGWVWKTNLPLWPKQLPRLMHTHSKVNTTRVSAYMDNVWNQVEELRAASHYPVHTVPSLAESTFSNTAKPAPDTNTQKLIETLTHKTKTCLHTHCHTQTHTLLHRSPADQPDYAHASAGRGTLQNTTLLRPRCLFLSPPSRRQATGCRAGRAAHTHNTPSPATQGPLCHPLAACQAVRHTHTHTHNSAERGAGWMNMPGRDLLDRGWQEKERERLCDSPMIVCLIKLYTSRDAQSKI